MHKLLFQIGSSFLRAFVASLAVLAAGILAAPNLNKMILLGVAALGASGAAGLRAVQAYIPALSIARYLGAPFGALADSFLRAGLSTFTVLAIGVLGSPDLVTDKAAWTGVLVGAVTAAVRVLQGALTAGEWPGKGVGIAPPPDATPPPAAPA